MLTCKRKGTNILIYDDNKLLGYMYPAYSLDEIWGISTIGNLFIDVNITSEELFAKAFNKELDSIPNIRKKMKEAFEIKQSIILVNIMSDYTYMPELHKNHLQNPYTTI